MYIWGAGRTSDADKPPSALIPFYLPHTHTKHTHIRTHTHAHTQNLLTYRYIVQQTTHLHKARINVKVAHAAVCCNSYPTTKGGNHIKSNNYVSKNSLVVIFLARSCFTSNGMHIPLETWILILILYLLNSALYLFANILKELHNLLYQTSCLINLFASSLCLFMKALKL